VTAPLAFVLKDGNILLIKRGTPPFKHYWSLPGGVAREDESPEEACIREVIEETGIIVQVQGEAGKINESTTVFLCKPLGGILSPNPPETTDVKWIPRNQAVYLRIPPFIREFLIEYDKTREN